MRSLQSYQDQTTGISALTLLCLKDMHTPFTHGELEFYRQSIRTKVELSSEMQQVQSFMVETEKCYGNGVFSKEEYDISVSKLTQLFKTLLQKKEILKSPYLRSSVAHELPTHLSL
jgi:hypothetical protein